MCSELVGSISWINISTSCTEEKSFDILIFFLTFLTSEYSVQLETYRQTHPPTAEDSLQVLNKQLVSQKWLRIVPV